MSQIANNFLWKGNKFPNAKNHKTASNQYWKNVYSTVESLRIGEEIS